MASDEGYIFEALEADPAAIHEADMARLAELLPDWQQRESAIEVLASRASADQRALLVDVASDVLASILGQVVQTIGIPQLTPQPATGLITVTTDGDETYVLPAGATMGGYLPDQTAVAVMTTTDTVIPAGTTSVTGVQVQTTTEGSFATLAPQPLDPDQAYSWLLDVTLTELTTPGSDGETDDEYLDRGSRRLTLLADQLILPADVRAFVAGLEGVGRVLVLNLVDATNPAVPVSPVEKCTTVVITAPDGSAPTGDLRTFVAAQLAARREVNYKWFVASPTYVPVTIELTVAAWADQIASPEQIAAVKDAVKAALLAWLSPAAFGSRGAYGGWEPTTTLRIGEIVSVADQVESVDYVNPTLVKISGVNADKVLTAPLAALPDPANTTITVNVVERQP